MSADASSFTLDDYAKNHPGLMSEFNKRSGGRRNGPRSTQNQRRINNSSSGRRQFNATNKRGGYDNNNRRQHSGERRDRNSFEGSQNWRTSAAMKAKTWTRDKYMSQNDSFSKSRQSASFGSDSFHRTLANRSIANNLNKSKNVSKTNIIISNLQYDVDSRLLNQVLQNNCVGFIKADVHKSSNGKPTGFGSATFASLYHAKKSVAFLSGNTLNGRQITASVMTTESVPNNDLSFFNTSQGASASSTPRISRRQIASPLNRSRQMPRQNGSPFSSIRRQHDFGSRRTNKFSPQSRKVVGKSSIRGSKPNFNWKQSAVTSEDLDRQLEAYKSKN